MMKLESILIHWRKSFDRNASDDAILQEIVLTIIVRNTLDIQYGVRAYGSRQFEGRLVNKKVSFTIEGCFIIP